MTYGGATHNLTTKPSGEKEYTIADYLGSTRVVLSSVGMDKTYDYEPFGGVIAQTGINSRLSFIDKEKDAENGLGDFGVRKYDDDIGRFLSVDPLWEKFRGESPYHYSYNNPVGYKDGTGLAGDPGQEHTKKHDIIRGDAGAGGSVSVPTVAALFKAFGSWLKEIGNTASKNLGQWFSGNAEKGGDLIRGISQNFTEKEIQNLFASGSEKITLYRGMTGSEGKGALFLTYNAKYAATYAKEGIVKAFNISKDAFKVLENQNIIETFQGSNASGLQGLEVKISNPTVVQEVLKTAVDLPK